MADDLWPEMRRVVADAAPRYVFAENVVRKAIDHAAEDLEAMGYRTRCIALAASDLGGDHARQRYWLAAYADSDSELLGAEHAEVAGVQIVRPGVWDTDPGKPRMADGVADRVERLRATGNGQIPAVVATAWQMLMTPNEF